MNHLNMVLAYTLFLGRQSCAFKLNEMFII